MTDYVLGFVLLIIGGWLLAATAYAQPGAILSKTLRSSLAWAPGLAWGFVSVLYFLGLDLYRQAPGGIFIVGSFLLAAGLATLPKREFPPAEMGHSPRSWALGARLLFFAVLLAGSLSFYFVVRARPGGGFDAMAIWNYAARFLARAGVGYRELIPELAPAHHMDYPLMLPASVASFWSLAGREGYEAQHLIQWSFYVGLALMCRELLRAHVSPMRADLAASFLFLVPSFMIWTTKQYADVALAYFLLAGIGGLSNRLSDCAKIRPPLLLTGFMLAAATWTKNEGLPLVLLMLVLYFPLRWRASSGRQCLNDLLRLVLGAVPVLFALVSFKVGWAPKNDLVIGMESTASDYLQDFERWRIVRDGFLAEWSPFGGKSFEAWNLSWPESLIAWGLAWPMTALLLAIGLWGRRLRLERHELYLLLVSIAAIAGWFLVYVLTPKNQEWHINTSLSRLLLQIFPFVFLTTVIISSDRVDRTQVLDQPRGDQELVDHKA